MFLPENATPQSQQSGVASVTPASPETTSEDVALMQRVFAAAMRNPNLIPPDFLAYLLDWLQTQRLQIPIGQVFGFSQFTAHSEILGGVTDTTNSSTPVDPPTHGAFELQGLGAGQYVVICGGDLLCAAAGTTTGRLKLFSAGADTFAEAVYANTGFASVLGVTTLALTDPSTTLSLKLSSDDGVTNVTLGARFIIALRYGN